uniref:Eukaryotic translation initiation factor 4C n=1 Tax=Esox lucius TaxID=8010 RepID=A0A3P8ZYJ0_ESOLU
MPKNKGKGGKNRRRGKNENESEKRELVFKEDGQEYAQVIKMLGNGRLEAMCFDGVKRLCHIRGKLRKKVWINTSDIILVGLRDYQDNKADVILKYNADEARSLKAYGELPEHAKINETDTFGPGDDEDIQFDDIGDDDEDIDDVSVQSVACGDFLGVGSVSVRGGLVTWRQMGFNDYFLFFPSCLFSDLRALSCT